MPELPRRLLVVAIPFPPWGGGGVMRVVKLVKYLDRLGWSIEVVYSDERHPEVVDPTMGADLPAGVVTRGLRGPMRGAGGAAKGLALRASGRPILGPMAGALNAIARAVLIPDRWIGWSLKASRIRPSVRPDVIVSSGPPHSVHVGASLLARRLHVPHVVDLRDEWGRNPLHWNPAPWHGFVDRLFERWAVHRASRVVVVAELSPGSLAARYPRIRDRIVVIPNGYDAEDFGGLPARVAAGRDRPVRFAYIGSLRSSVPVGAFFAAFGARARVGEARLDLIGYIAPNQAGAAREHVPSSALSIRPTIAHRAALAEGASADVLVVFTAGGGWGDGTLTGKIFEYLALRRPILVVGPPGPARALVQDAGAGVGADPDDRVGLDAALTRAIELARAPRFPGAPPEVLRRFERSRIAADYAAVLAYVIAAARPSR